MTPNDRAMMEWMKGDDATPELDVFLAAYREDDNWWWCIDCGHHRNLFDEAVERMEAFRR